MNHIIDWENTKVIEIEPQERARKIREAIWIKQQDITNRDVGTIILSPIYYSLRLEKRYAAELEVLKMVTVNARKSLTKQCKLGIFIFMSFIFGKCIINCLPPSVKF